MTTPTARTPAAGMPEVVCPNCLHFYDPKTTKLTPGMEGVVGVKAEKGPYICEKCEADRRAYATTTSTREDP